MPPIDLAMEVAALAGAPLLIFGMRRKWLGLAFGLLWFWGMMVLATEYNLATDSEYDSFAPILSILFGWIFAAIYCAPWFAVALAVSAWRRHRKETAPKTMA
jgi:hypothetical protein